MTNTTIISRIAFDTLLVIFFCIATLPLEANQKAKDQGGTSAVHFSSSTQREDASSHAVEQRAESSFLITGKLFGYFRSPDKETESSGTDPANPCPSEDTIRGDEGTMSRDAVAFMTVRERNPGAILLGTGDNFSPNYYSRVIVSKTRNLHKEEEEWDPNKIGGAGWVKYADISDALADQLRAGRGTVPTDNVACFLSYAGYTAIVPGKHDFFYGPERLRQLARFLAGIPDGYSHYHPVQMLAANLVIRTTWAKDHKPVADTMKHSVLPFDTQYGRSDSRQRLEIEDFTDGGFAYPSLRRIKVKFSGWPKEDTAKVKLFLCMTIKDSDPDNLHLPGADDKCGNIPALIPSNPAAPTTSSDPTIFPMPVESVTEREYTLPTNLQQNRNYGICVENPDSPRAGSGPWFYCFRFAVFVPFFQFEEPPLDHSVVRFQNPRDYVVTKLPDGSKVAIFGVVDTDLTASIGNLNYSWKNLGIKNPGTPKAKILDKADLRFKTAISMGDPVIALEQLQQKFDEACPDFHGLRVLLAHMSPTKAQLLAARLTGPMRFDIVVSAADDSISTPNGTIEANTTVLSSGTASTPAPKLRPPSLIFVPPSHQLSRHHLAYRWVNVRELQVTTDRDLRWSYKVSGDPVRVDLPSFGEDPSAGFWLAICNQLYAAQPQHRCNRVGGKIFDRAPDQIPREWDETTRRDALQQLVLSLMQKKVGADVAMLQGRDFYLDGLEEFYIDHCQQTAGKCSAKEVPELTAPQQEVLDRMIWKGDFVFHISVQGSTLKTVLDESKGFAKTEKSALASINELGRALVTAGVHYDEGRNEYRINDAPLDPARLYTVATSDYIALGDTGYPELGTPPVGDPPDPITSEKRLIRIADVVCRSFSGKSSNSCDDPVRDYFDELASLRPNDARSGDTQLHKLFVWTFLRGPLGQPSDWERSRNYAKQNLPSDVDKRIQDRSIGRIAVDKLAIGFDGLTHNYSESNLAADFAGIPNSQVTAKHFHSWDTDIESSAKRFGQWSDPFVSENLQYSAKFTSQATPPRDVNQTTNLLQIDFGSYVHGHQMSLPRLQWLVGGHFETQPFQPFSTITINPVGAITSPQNLLFNPNRSRLTLARTGPRWQNRKSFFEMGGQAGANFRAIRQFDIKTSDTGLLVLTCPLEAQQTLNKCVNNFNKANPTNPIDQTFFVQTENETRRRFGIYWNSSLAVPLDSRITLQIDNQGDFLFPVSHDNSTDTRFRHQYTQAIKFYVFPNLDFEPTYKIFLFENKVQQNFLFQQEFLIKINLAFELWNWRERYQELRYQKPSSTQ